MRQKKKALPKFGNPPPFIVALFFQVTLVVAVEIFIGLGRITPVQLALGVLGVLGLLYYMYKDIYSGLMPFLIMLFFSFCLYPILTYYLYKDNEKNYNASAEMINSEAELAHERLLSLLTVEQMQFLKTAIENDPKPFPATYFFGGDTISIRKTTTLGGLFHPLYKYTFSVGPSRETSLYTETYPMPPKGGTRNPLLQIAIDEEIEWLKFLTKVENNPQGIVQLSEVWLEAVTLFSTGHMSPARNLPKILNVLQILSMLFITTTIINTFNSSLQIKRK